MRSSCRPLSLAALLLTTPALAQPSEPAHASGPAPASERPSATAPAATATAAQAAPPPANGDLSTFVDLLDRPAAKVDRSQGDIHPSGNPHYMLDPRVVERLAVELGKRMAELDPGARQTYLDNTKGFVNALRAARAGWEATLGPLEGREVVTFHRSLAYLASWLGLSVVGYLEPRPGIPPNPRHVAELVALAKTGHVWALLQESWYPANTSTLVAQHIGARFVQLPGGANFAQGESYIAYVNRLVNALAAGL